MIVRGNQSIFMMIDIHGCYTCQIAVFIYLLITNKLIFYRHLWFWRWSWTIDMWLEKSKWLCSEMGAGSRYTFQLVRGAAYGRRARRRRGKRSEDVTLALCIFYCVYYIFINTFIPGGYIFFETSLLAAPVLKIDEITIREGQNAFIESPVLGSTGAEGKCISFG